MKQQQYHETILGLHTNARLLDEGDAVAGMRETMQAAAAALEVARASVWFLYDDRLVCEELFELTENRHSSGMVLMANEYPDYFSAIKSERAIDASDARTDSRTREFRGGYLEPLSITSMLDAAIWKEGRMRGVVCLEHTGRSRVWTPDEVTFAGQIADFISVILLRAERKRGEEALQAEKKFTDTAINTLLGPFYVLDEKGRFIRWNKALTAILGVNDDDMFLRDSLELIHPEDREFMAGKLAEVLEKGYAESETRVVLHGGKEVRHFLTNGRKMTVDGTPYIVGSGIDITERKRAEESLKSSEEKFAKFFMSAPAAISVSSLYEGRILDVNQEYERILGYRRDELIGHTSSELGFWLDPKDREQIVRLLRGGGKVKDLELRVWAKNGSVLTLRYYGESIELGGKSYLLSAFVDVTARKQAEEELKRHRAHLEEMVEARTSELSAANKKLRELDRLKSMFIASMSHELRTPLNSIIGFTGMTLQGMSGSLNDEQKDNLTRAYFSAKHLLNLITDVIDISKIEAGRIEAYPEEFSLRMLIDDAVATVAPQLRDGGLTLQIDLPDDVNLYTDRKRLLQCLINFLSNAVKFTEAGTITVAGRSDGGRVSVSVADTGIGIAEKDMPRLFEPFERLETHLRVRTGGTGLGLYLTRKLAAEVLHGRISVKSIEGEGSTFTITLPVDIREKRDALRQGR